MLKDRSISTILFTAIFVPAFFILIGLAVYSLRWRLTIDSTLLMYCAMLIDKFDYLPYKDFVDPNMLGTYYLYYLAGHFSNYSDLGFRIADLVYFSLILTVTFVFLKRLSLKTAWAAVIIFGLIYMDESPPLSFQREYLMILPLITALYITEAQLKIKSALKFVLAGIMLGCVFLIKPHGGIFLPALILLRCWFRYTDETVRPLGIIGYTVAGFMIPVAVAAGFLQVNGLWADFLEVALNYWPQYSELSGEYTLVSGGDKYLFIFRKFFEFGELDREFIPGLIGILVALKYADISTEQKKSVKVIIGIAVVALIYPVFSAKMWFYHYFIFYYFLIMLGAMGLMNLKIKGRARQQACAIGLLAVFLFFTFPPVWELYERRNPFVGDRDPLYWKKADRISSVLARELKDGDYVQPLDWCRGVHQALLTVQAPLATKVMYNIDLYHHISSPYTQRLRKEFINALETKPPRFIVRSAVQAPWITGPDTTTEFPELEQVLSNKYLVHTQDRDFIIYERKDQSNG